MTSEVGDIFH